MGDRRVYVVLCAGLFMAWSYRVGLRHLRDDPSSWLSFVTLWLPTAIVLGLLLAYGFPALRQWLTNLRSRRR